MPLAFRIFVTVLLLFPSSAISDVRDDRPMVLGFLEEARLYPGEFRILAKLDTGADTSSLHAEDVEVFEKDGKQYAKFQVSNQYGEKRTYERPLQRHAQIKSKRSVSQIRPVVKISICVAGILEAVEVTLVDRSNFSSDALIGRNFLAGKILVDSSSAYTTDYICHNQEKN